MPFSRLPEGWMDYTPLGKRIAKTRFICFKVPLLPKLLASQQVPVENRFSPDILLKMLKDRDEELGMIIDLTNTNKYYDPEAFKSLGIRHEKIFTAGKIVPQPNVTNKFRDFVNDFIAENADNDRLIGVHCTHGLNRTGYIVCRYMVDHMGFSPEDALSGFNSARGHPVERENYIDALHGRPYTDPPRNREFRVWDERSRPHRGQQNHRGRAAEEQNHNWRERSPVCNLRPESVASRRREEKGFNSHNNERPPQRNAGRWRGRERASYSNVSHSRVGRSQQRGRSRHEPPDRFTPYNNFNNNSSVVEQQAGMSDNCWSQSDFYAYGLGTGGYANDRLTDNDRNAESQRSHHFYNDNYHRNVGNNDRGSHYEGRHRNRRYREQNGYRFNSGHVRPGRPK